MSERLENSAKQTGGRVANHDLAWEMAHAEQPHIDAALEARNEAEAKYAQEHSTHIDAVMGALEDSSGKKLEELSNDERLKLVRVLRSAREILEHTVETDPEDDEPDAEKPKQPTGTKKRSATKADKKVNKAGGTKSPEEQPDEPKPDENKPEKAPETKKRSEAELRFESIRDWLLTYKENPLEARGSRVPGVRRVRERYQTMGSIQRVGRRDWIAPAARTRVGGLAGRIMHHERVRQGQGSNLHIRKHKEHLSEVSQSIEIGYRWDRRLERMLDEYRRNPDRFENREVDMLAYYMLENEQRHKAYLRAMRPIENEDDPTSSHRRYTNTPDNMLVKFEAFMAKYNGESVNSGQAGTNATGESITGDTTESADSNQLSRAIKKLVGKNLYVITHDGIVRPPADGWQIVPERSNKRVIRVSNGQDYQIVRPRILLAWQRAHS